MLMEAKVQVDVTTLRWICGIFTFFFRGGFLLFFIYFL